MKLTIDFNKTQLATMLRDSDVFCRVYTDAIWEVDKEKGEEETVESFKQKVLQFHADSNNYCQFRESFCNLFFLDEDGKFLQKAFPDFDLPDTIDRDSGQHAAILWEKLYVRGVYP